MAADTTIWYGENLAAKLVEDFPATMEIDKTGVARLSQQYSCFWANAPMLVARVARHPTFTWLLRKRATVQREEANIAKVTIEFEGINPDQNQGTTTGTTGEVTTFSIEGSSDAEPIESHPSFKDFAGEWDNKATWKNGADFGKDKEQGKFLGFAPTVNGQLNKKGGVRSFLSPGFIYVRVRTIPRITTNTIGVNMNKIGKIDTPPSSGVLPSVSGNRNFLLIGCQVEEIGDGLRVTERWKLSGPNGWDVDIYG